MIAIAISGLGKIARDQHLPAVIASGQFDLAATVDPFAAAIPGVPHFTDIAAMLAAMPHIAAMSVCTPPQVRAVVAAEAERKASEGASKVRNEMMQSLVDSEERYRAQIEMLELFTLLNVARVGQVHLFYRARLTSDQFEPGTETIEAKLFRENEIPWDDIAFRTVKETLDCYFADRKAGHYGIHTLDIT